MTAGRVRQAAGDVFELAGIVGKHLTSMWMQLLKLQYVTLASLLTGASQCLASRSLTQDPSWQRLNGPY
jgi:hypothetical protein